MDKVVFWIAAAAILALPLSATASLKAGDELFKKRGDGPSAEKALTEYRSSYAENRTSEAGWRLAMADYFVGLRLREKPEHREALYSEGISAGKSAIALSPDCAPCHFWTAINMALYGQSVGVFKMLFSLNEIQEHLRKSVDLDPAYAYAGAYRLLGLIDQNLPGILGGSDERAEKQFQRAITAAPDEPLNYLFLTRLLKRRDERRAETLSWIDRGLALPDPPADRLESIEAKRDLRALREEILSPQSSKQAR